LGETGLDVLEVGPGCSDLPLMLIEHCRRHDHRLHLIDSPEMLAQLPDAPFLAKRPGLFPKCRADLADLIGAIDVMISYSVLQHVFLDANPFDFVDLAVELLAPQGELLIGDIPNVSKRMRFFSSDAGIAFHQRFTGGESKPEIAFNVPHPGKIDDAVMIGLLARARAAGVDAYILSQPPALPMHNRREDILMRKP
ncbi:MAG: SAM-dependent methyltransferase, partial [Bradyrhizobium sp.]